MSRPDKKPDRYLRGVGAIPAKATKADLWRKLDEASKAFDDCSADRYSKEVELDALQKEHRSLEKQHYNLSGIVNEAKTHIKTTLIILHPMVRKAWRAVNVADGEYPNIAGIPSKSPLSEVDDPNARSLLRLLDILNLAQ